MIRLNAKALLATVTVGALTLGAVALPAAVTKFDKLYNVKEGSALHKAKCMVCHETKFGGKKLNPYGKDIQAAMKKEGTKKITEEILKSVEKLDSAKLGKTNLHRIQADKLPGGN